MALYPYFYVELISLNPILLTVLTARNTLLCVVLVWAVRAVVLVGRHAPDGLVPTQASSI